MKQWILIWSEDCYDANFVLTGGTSGTTSDDKVGIMITTALGFQFMTKLNIFDSTKQMMIFYPE